MEDRYQKGFEKYKGLMEVSSEMITLYFDSELNLESWNSGFYRVCSIEKDQLDDELFQKIIGEVKVLLKRSKKVKEGGISNEMVFKIDGRRLFLKTYINSFEGSDGSIYYIFRGYDITESKLLEEKILKRNRVLEEKTRVIEESNRFRTTFYNNMTHELRTPLSGIIGVTSLIKATNKLEGRVVEHIDLIESNSKNLLSIINQILDLSKIDSGKISPSYSDIPISLPVNDAVNLASSLLYNNDRVKISKIIDGEALNITTDYGRLRQILNNLISNSVKFTDEGFIEVHANVGERFFTISVRDSGIGIPKSVEEKIFEPFIQADSGITKVYGGTGLGLAITHKLVKMLGGTIEVLSEEGVGTEFILKFPRDNN